MGAKAGYMYGKKGMEMGAEYILIPMVQTGGAMANAGAAKVAEAGLRLGESALTVAENVVNSRACKVAGAVITKTAVTVVVVPVAGIAGLLTLPFAGLGLLVWGLAYVGLVEMWTGYSYSTANGRFHRRRGT